MSTALHKRSILKKTVEVGGATLLSRVLGLARSVLQVRYLGADVVGEAFRAAYKLPNMLRQIFAEGALSAAVVPTFVANLKRGDSKDQLGSLMSLSFLVFEGTVLLLCALAMWKAQWVVHFFAPGFPEAKMEIAIRLFRILMPFIFFISSSALLAGALQSLHHFWVPALSPAWLNVVYIIALLCGIYAGYSVEFLCSSILFGGFIQLMAHTVIYFRLGMQFSGITRYAWESFRSLLAKFIPAMLGMSVLQFSVIVDSRFASYLPHAYTLMEIASGFLRIPVGTFAVAFSTILLPHFSRVQTYAPKRLSFYLLESTKFVFWVTVPTAILLSFFSEKIFVTLYLSEKFPMELVMEAKYILSAFLLGLFFLSLNKILMNIFYSLHQQWIPAIVVVCGTCVNYVLNSLMIETWKATGLALATSASVAVQALLFFIILKYGFNFKLYLGNLISFCVRYIIQVTIVFGLFYGLYLGITGGITYLIPQAEALLTRTLFVWVWIAPLCSAAMYVLYRTRTWFRVRIHFLNS